MLDIIWEFARAIITWANLGFWGWLLVILVALGFASGMIDSIRWFTNKLK